MTENSEQTKNGSGRGTTRLVVVVLLLACAAAGGIYYLLERNYEKTDDAFIEGTVVQISPRVGGKVAKVYVSENQRVSAGDLLFEIDAEPYQAALDVQRAAADLAEAKRAGAEIAVGLMDVTSGAGVDEAEAGLVAARDGVQRARAEVAAADAEMTRAQTDYRRYEQLDTSTISAQQKDQAAAVARVATARLEQAKKQLAGFEAQVNAAAARLEGAQSAPQQVALKRSELEQRTAEANQALATARVAELNLEYTKVYAPESGWLARKSVHVGEQVQAGQAVLAIVEDEMWVVANFKETQLTLMRPGQPVAIKVDAYPRKSFKAHVDSVQAGTGARFSLLPAQNATGNYVKVVQRVPVKILFDEPPGADYPIAPGMSVVPRVRVR